MSRTILQSKIRTSLERVEDLAACASLVIISVLSVALPEFLVKQKGLMTIANSPCERSFGVRKLAILPAS